MDPICDVTVTADDHEWLVVFVRDLVRDRLVACGNIAATKVRSIYRWKGEIEDADEYVVVLHTRQSLAEKVIERTEAEHPYETPQVLVLPVIAASAGYHRWVLDSTIDPTEAGEPT